MRTHPTPRARRRSLLPAIGACSAVAVLSGCGLIGVRTADEAGLPVGISVAETQGPAPSPTPTGPNIPAGWTLHRVDFAGSCPARVEVALPPSAKVAPGAIGGHTSFTFGAPHSNMTLRINCTDAFGQDEPQEELESIKQYEFRGTDLSGTKLADRDIKLPGGAAWAFKAEVGEGSTAYIGLGADGHNYGVRAAVQAEGKLSSIKIDAAARSDAPDDDATAEKITQHIFIQKHLLTIPDWP